MYDLTCVPDSQVIFLTRSHAGQSVLFGNGLILKADF